MNDPLWEKILVAAIGPIVTAILAFIVANIVASRIQERREKADLRRSLTGEMTEAASALYFALQEFWRLARDVPLRDRRTEASLSSALEKLTRPT